MMYTMMQRRRKLNECGRRSVLYSHTFRQAKMFPNKIRDIFVVETMFPYLDSQKRTGCSRSAAVAVIKSISEFVRIDRLLRLDDSKSVASCQQAFFYPRHKFHASCFNNNLRQV